MTSNGKQFTVTREMLTAVAGISARYSKFAFVLFCYITNHLMTGPLGNSEFCFPRISMFPETKSRETLRFEGNKIHRSPRDQSLSVYSYIRFFHQSHNTVHLGGLFTLKQWIFSSLKHDPVPRENILYCFYVKNPPKRITLWDRENSQYRLYLTWTINTLSCSLVSRCPLIYIN